MKGFMVLEDGSRWAVDTDGSGCELPHNIRVVNNLEFEHGLAEYQRIANQFVSDEHCYDIDDSYPYPEAELPTTQHGPKTREDQEHFDKWQERWKVTGETNDLLKALWPPMRIQNVVYEENALLKALPAPGIELHSSPFLKQGELVVFQRKLPDYSKLELEVAQKIRDDWYTKWPEMADYYRVVGLEEQLKDLPLLTTGRTPSIAAATVAPPAGGFKKDDEVLLHGKWWRLGGSGPATGSWVATTSAGDLSVLYRDDLQGAAWKRFGYGNPTQSEPDYRPAYGSKPAAAACRCPIKDLTSVGHTDLQCPERKQKK